MEKGVGLFERERRLIMNPWYYKSRTGADISALEMAKIVADTRLDEDFKKSEEYAKKFGNMSQEQREKCEKIGKELTKLRGTTL